MEISLIIEGSRDKLLNIKNKSQFSAGQSFFISNHAAYHFVPWHSKHDTPVDPPFKSEP